MMDYPCDVILDLIALVKDGVASERSADAVSRHIAACETCRHAFEGYTVCALPPPEAEQKIVAMLRRTVTVTRMLLFCCSLLLGLTLFHSAGMFYNFLIMPFIGLVGYFIWPFRWFLPSAVVFAATYLYNFAVQLVDVGFAGSTFLAPLLYSLICTLFTLIGTVIGMLLRFAFQKQ